MSRRKVLFFISSLNQGGAERQMVELIRGLDPARFETRLVLCHAKTPAGVALLQGLAA